MAKVVLRKDELVVRVKQLLGEDKGWSEIAKIVAAEGFSDSNGNAFKPKALKKNFTRWTRGCEDKTISTPTGRTENNQTESGINNPTQDSGQIMLSENDPTHDETLKDPTTSSQEILLRAFLPITKEPDKRDSPTKKAEIDPTQQPTHAGDEAENGTTKTLEEVLPENPTDITQETEDERGLILKLGTSLASAQLLFDPTRRIVSDPTAEAHTPLSQSNPAFSPAMTEELELAVIDLVKKEVHRILAGVRVEEVRKPGRGGKAFTVKKSFSIPRDLWEEFDKRFEGKILSNHVAAALRMYLNATTPRDTDQGDQP